MRLIELCTSPVVAEVIEGRNWRCEMRQIFADLDNGLRKQTPEFQFCVGATDWLFFV